MKQFGLIALLCVCVSSAYAQKVRFTDSTNTWKCWWYVCGGASGVGGYGTEKYVADTLMNGKAYRRMLPANYYVREDTAAQKVWACKRIVPYTDTDDHLLYDYSLALHDTFRTYTNVHFVSGIDSTMINGVSHKVWHMASVSSPYGMYDYDVIEGAGCTTYPFFPFRTVFMESCQSVSCFANKGINPLFSPKVGGYFDNSSSCAMTFGVGVDEVARRDRSVTVVPNPVDETSVILLPGDDNTGRLTILDYTGRIVSLDVFANATKVLIGDKIKQPGLYFFRITDSESGLVYPGKFVVR